MLLMLKSSAICVIMSCVNVVQFHYNTAIRITPTLFSQIVSNYIKQRSYKFCVALTQLNKTYD